jgi:hypothetical protein
VIKFLTYTDCRSDKHEFIVFSESARSAGIPQYLDNRQLYGYNVEINLMHDNGESVVRDMRHLIQKSWEI